MEHGHESRASQTLAKVYDILVIPARGVRPQENQDCRLLSFAGHPVDVRDALAVGLGIAHFLADRLCGKPCLGLHAKVQDLQHEEGGMIPCPSLRGHYEEDGQPASQREERQRRPPEPFCQGPLHGFSAPTES